MFLTIGKRLDLFFDARKKIKDGLIKFDPSVKNFGFKRMDQLFPVVSDEIKGFPCLIYNKLSDTLKYGVKIIPMERRYDLEKHPSKVEGKLLEEFTNLVVDFVTPHITFYFDSFTVSNKKQSLTEYPLKKLRRDILPESIVLVSEYVPGGSIEEWIQEQVNITEKQWKYIIFSVAWTLLVLGDKYQFLHNDFHYGNILIDSSIDPMDKTIMTYSLTDDKGTKYNFNIPNCGVLASFWDMEYGTVMKDTERLPATPNDFFKHTEDNIPHEYNPYYDIHCFLTSIIELNIPDGLREFIHELYPKCVIPPPYKGRSESRYTSSTRFPSTDSRDSRVTCSTCTGSSNGRDYFDDEINTDNYYEYHYHTDEETSGSCNDDNENSDNMSICSKCNKNDGDIEMENGETKECVCSCSSGSDYSSCDTNCSCERNEVRTEYMLGDRILNGTEKKLKLPTPLDIITHEYFANYLNEEKPKTRKKNANLVFSYTMEGPM
jgi:hypothetical protein